MKKPEGKGVIVVIVVIVLRVPGRKQGKVPTTLKATSRKKGSTQPHWLFVLVPGTLGQGVYATPPFHSWIKTITRAEIRSPIINKGKLGKNKGKTRFVQKKPALEI